MLSVLHYLKRARNEALWLALGQVLIALGGILGISLLTRIMGPSSFGSFILHVGIAALGMAVMINPIFQTGMRFFSIARNLEDLLLVRSAALGYMCISLFLVAILALLLGWFGHAVIETSWKTILSVVLLIVVDSYRTFETSLLNAARQQRVFILWRAVDTWMRPIAAVACLQLLGVAIWSAILGYVIATLIVSISFAIFVQPKKRAIRVMKNRARVDQPPITLQSMLHYAVPLLPMGAVGWFLGTGDRYIIGAMLSLEAVGLYAAIYSITSRPFIAVGSFLEVILRPRLYDAATTESWTYFNRLFLIWVSATIVFSIPIVILILFWSEEIISIFLGEKFLQSETLMIWISIGYMLCIINQPLTRVLHAYRLTQHVLWITIVTTIVALLSTVTGILWKGLPGAAMAVPFYYGFRLVFAIFLIRYSKIAGTTFLTGYIRSPSVTDNSKDT